MPGESETESASSGSAPARCEAVPEPLQERLQDRFQERFQERFQGRSPGRFEGKVAVVTGGSRGIGRAVSVRLAREGAAVLAAFASRRDAAEELVREAAAEGWDIRICRCDVSAREQVRELF